MNDKKPFVEKRKHERFIVREGAFAVMTPGHKNLGLIKNISKGGLAYRHIADGNKTNGLYKLDIFLSTKHFYLKDIPFKTVSVFNEESEFPYSFVLMKHRCIQFGQLNPDQKQMLDYFIINHTIKKRSEKDRRQSVSTHYKGPERRRNVERRMTVF
jgi:hypothetical protein